MAGKKGRILLVDDEPQVRSFVKAFLNSARFEVVEANDGVEAVQIVESGAEPFDILVTDVKMPRMDGMALARILTERFPRLPVLFISGYTSAPNWQECGGVSRWTFLAKPFLPKALLQRISELLDAEAGTHAAGG